MPPPANVLPEAPVRLMVPVPVTVRLVAVAQLQGIAETLRVHVPEPTATVLVDVPVPMKLKEVTLYPLASNVPADKVNGADDALGVKASCSVTEPPGVLTVIGCVNDLPALVSC